jgi:hypothetical protein
VFTARYALSPYIKQIRFVFKGLRTDKILGVVCIARFTAFIMSPTEGRKYEQQINYPTRKFVKIQNLAQIECLRTNCGGECFELWKIKYQKNGKTARRAVNWGVRDGRHEKHTQNVSERTESPFGRIRFQWQGDQIWIQKKYDVGVRTAFKRLRTLTSGGLLWERQWIVGYNRGRELTNWVTVNFSQRLCSNTNSYTRVQSNMICILYKKPTIRKQNQRNLMKFHHFILLIFQWYIYRKIQSVWNIKRKGKNCSLHAALSVQRTMKYELTCI